MWIYGSLAGFFLRRHIARELRPFCSMGEGATRGEALAACRAKLAEHFGVAWPTPEMEAEAERNRIERAREMFPH